jgi:hypothetical protein
MISRSFIYRRTLTNSVIYFPFGFVVDIYIHIIGDSKLTMFLRKVSNLTLSIVNHSRLNNIDVNSNLVTEINSNSGTSINIIGNSTLQVK